MIHAYLDSLEAPVSDDEDEERPGVEFVLQNVGPVGGADSLGSPAPGECKTVVICSAGAAAAFVTSAFPLKSVPWSLEVKGEFASMFQKPPKSPRFFVLDFAGGEEHPVGFVVLEEPVVAEHATAWAETVLASFGKAAEVVSLGRIFRAEYYCPRGTANRPQEPYLCGLWTEAWDELKRPGSSVVSVLPTPNVVDGLNASLLTQCETERRRCLVALALQDGAHVGEGCIRAFEALKQVFAEVGCAQDAWRKPNYREALRQLIPPPSMGIYA
eukprot:TRINITY_DN67084_c0_g1_i1.p1 TRINITY_DN67084_c0_g1~~TRINITY_DN67084_c0_g1_i1.p1  ORF type:complete len:294 (+),score=51.91 TRINITY_DN67084_c0_g1_i1:71-883(+)